MQGQCDFGPQLFAVWLSPAVCRSLGEARVVEPAAAQGPVTRELQVARGVGLNAGLVARRGPGGTMPPTLPARRSGGGDLRHPNGCHHSGLMAFLWKKT